MDAQQIKGKEKVHSMDSTSRNSVQTYKQSRQPVPETMSGDGPEQQNHHAFMKIRDKKGWKHGIIVNGNRHHWKCKYCLTVGRSSGLSGLKSHLVGDRKKAKKCLAVPEDVSAEIKQSMDVTKERRQKRAALKRLNNVKSKSSSDDGEDKNDPLTLGSDALTGVNTHVPEKDSKQTNTELQKTAQEAAFITSSEPGELIPSTSDGLISDVQKDCSSIFRGLAQVSMALAHVPGGTCYCSFCILERANEGPQYEEIMLRLHIKMARVADMMLSAAEKLSAEEQSLTMIQQELLGSVVPVNLCEVIFTVLFQCNFRDA